MAAPRSVGDVKTNILRGQEGMSMIMLEEDCRGEQKR